MEDKTAVYLFTMGYAKPSGEHHLKRDLETRKRWLHKDTNYEQLDEPNKFLVDVEFEEIRAERLKENRKRKRRLRKLYKMAAKKGMAFDEYVVWLYGVHKTNGHLPVQRRAGELWE